MIEEAKVEPVGFSKSQNAEVKRWQGRITEALQKWDPDFKRMKENMQFASGLQWVGQKDLVSEDRYLLNLTLRLISQKVATIYAKNPEAEAVPRKKLYFQLWDGNVESLVDAIGQASQIVATGQPLPPELAAFFADVEQGRDAQKQVEKIAKTLSLLYQFEVDSQHIDFKEQMKAAVRRTDITGVAYCKPVFCRTSTDYKKVSSVDVGSTEEDRAGRIKGLMREISEGDLGEDSAEFATLHSLMLSMQSSPADSEPMQERLEFDFPPATSIIVDPRCRSLKGFVSARWIAQRFLLTVDEVNTIFSTDIKVGNGEGSADDQTSLVTYDVKQQEKQGKGMVWLYEIFDYETKTRCFIVEGHGEFVMEPEPLEVEITGFWPVFALTFNDVETEPDKDSTIYPPSLVDLVKSSQKEWNRRREALRDHRNANAPKYLARKGILGEEDKNALRNAEPNSIIELSSVPPDQPIDRFIAVMQHAPIDPLLYEVDTLEKDILMAAGMQASNLGPAQANVTATVGNIAEQSRMDVTASNIDDLDMFLSHVAQAGGEMLLKLMSKETVLTIVGPGAAWPELPETREALASEILLTVKAASSGRPNKAIAIQNFQQLAPMLLQAGANQVGLVEEGVRRLDDNLDVSKFFPLTPPQGSNVLPSGGPEGKQSMANPPPGPMEPVSPTGSAPSAPQVTLPSTT